MCRNYDDPCDDCMGIPWEKTQCFFCEMNDDDCICDQLTDAYLENRIDDVFQEPSTGS
jgi:hypothetical protein